MKSQLACVPSRRGETAVSQHKKLVGVEKKESKGRSTIECTKSPSSGPSPTTSSKDELVELAHGICSLMSTVEHKDPPKAAPKEGPIVLGGPGLGLRHVATEASEVLRTVLSSSFAGKMYRFRLGTVLNMSSTGSGTVNALAQVSTLSSNIEFGYLALIFEEFFVQKMTLRWEPVSMYNYPLTGVVATSVSSLPMGVADLQHNFVSGYGSLTAAAQNFRFELKNTGRPFKYSWRNTEKKSSNVLPLPGGGLTQAWCLTSNVADYTGQVQFITQSAPPALPTSEVLGTFLVFYDVYFRTRV